MTVDSPFHLSQLSNSNGVGIMDHALMTRRKRDLKSQRFLDFKSVQCYNVSHYGFSDVNIIISLKSTICTVFHW